jgi:hypothetical protein
MPNLVRTPPGFEQLSQVFGRLDHFASYASGGEWTTVATDSGSATVGDAANGELSLAPSDGTVADNDELYVKATNETLLFAANRAISFASLVKWTEGNVDDLNVAVGFMNAVAADSILDNGGGPKASFSGAVFYKVDGGTVWRCRSSLGTTFTDSITNITAGGSAYQLLEIEFRAIDTALGEISFLIDGQVVRDTNNYPIKHQITYTSATEMQAFVGAKNGAATTVESLKVDAIAYWQNR